MSSAPDSTPCPHCEAPVPVGALACAACGSDAETGWSEDAAAWAGELPDGYGDEADDDSDDDEFLRREGLHPDAEPSQQLLERCGKLLVLIVFLVLVVLRVLR